MDENKRKIRYIIMKIIMHNVIMDKMVFILLVVLFIDRQINQPATVEYTIETNS